MDWYQIFLEILNMSLTASIVILFVLLARLFLKKTPKIFSYVLWAVVLFRLICPVSVSAGVSVLGLFESPAAERNGITSTVEYVPSDIAHTEYPEIHLPTLGSNSVIADVNEAINENLPQGREQLAADPLEATISFATYIWLAGMVVMLIYSFVSYGRLKRRLVGAVPFRENIYLADHIASPFVMGLIRPRIYLLSSLGEKEQEYIILHEKYHIRRGDHIIKVLSFAALCIHWFNPLVWLAFVLSGKDMEMSCDEAVVRKMGQDIRADYAASLLNLATGQRILAGTPLAFGEGNTKGRIKNLAGWKKPSLVIVLAASLVCVAAIVICAVNPKEADGGTEYTVSGSYLGETQVGEAGEIASKTAAGENVGDVDVETLENAISAAILERNKDRYSDALFHCESHVIFETEETEESPLDERGMYDRYVTAYMLVMDNRYDLSDGVIMNEGGSHIPTVLTFGIKNEEYTLLEYWQSDDGSYYESSIREKFPDRVEEEAMDTQKYVLSQIQTCYSLAVQYAGLDTDNIVENLLDEIMSSTGTESGLAGYIENHSIAYRELTYYGVYTLQYCFREFLKDGQTDLRGLLMANVCQEIMHGLGETLLTEVEPATGQEWFDAFCSMALSRGERYTEEELKQDYPASRLFLQMAPQYTAEIEKLLENEEEIDWEKVLKQRLDIMRGGTGAVEGDSSEKK